MPSPPMACKSAPQGDLMAEERSYYAPHGLAAAKHFAPKTGPGMRARGLFWGGVQNRSENSANAHKLEAC